jgi:hypothetical protein
MQQALRRRVLPAVAVAVAVGLAIGVSAMGATVKPPSVARACADVLGAHRIAVTGAPPPAAVRADYAVLRRARTPGDLPPSRTALTGAISGWLSTYDPGAVRRLSAIGGGGVYLVSGTPLIRHPSAACRRVLPALLRELLAYDAAQIGTGPAYCLVVIVSGNSPVADLCAGYTAVRAGYAYTTVGAVHSMRATLLALVPDGVGAANYTFEHLAAPVPLAVADNLATAPRPAAFARLDRVAPKLLREPKHLRSVLRGLIEDAIPTQVTWYSSPGGPIVGSFDRPPGLVARTLRLAVAAFTLARTTTTATGGCTDTTVGGQRVQRCTTCTVTTVAGGRTKRSCVTATTHPKGARRARGRDRRPAAAL